jgi:histidine phosphotransferase ChpT
MQYEDDLLLTQLLCSRLCHDLITPVGAINSGLELLAENEGGDTDDIMKLISQSAETARQRLLLCRFAFGYGASNSLSSLDELEEPMRQFLDPKHKLIWQLPTNTHAEQKTCGIWAKLISNIAMCLMDTAPYGGTLYIQPDKDAYLVRIAGDRIMVNNETLQAIQNLNLDIQSLNPRTVQVYFMHRIAAQLGRNLTISTKTDSEFCLSTINIYQNALSN